MKKVIPVLIVLAILVFIGQIVGIALNSPPLEWCYSQFYDFNWNDEILYESSYCFRNGKEVVNDEAYIHPRDSKLYMGILKGKSEAYRSELFIKGNTIPNIIKILILDQLTPMDIFVPSGIKGDWNHSKTKK